MVMANLLREVEVVWQRRKYGTRVGQSVRGACLAHVVFADDATLLARSWLSLKRMVPMLRDALAKQGLKLHPLKCKVQTNGTAGVARGDVVLEEGFSVNVLPEGDSLEVLGTALSLFDVTGMEIEHRTGIAWRKFWAMKSLLMNQNVSVFKRLKLFDSSVGGCILYGACSWTPRAAAYSALKSTQCCGAYAASGEHLTSSGTSGSFARRTNAGGWPCALAYGIGCGHRRDRNGSGQATWPGCQRRRGHGAQPSGETATGRRPCGTRAPGKSGRPDVAG